MILKIYGCHCCPRCSRRSRCPDYHSSLFRELCSNFKPFRLIVGGAVNKPRAGVGNGRQ